MSKFDRFDRAQIRQRPWKIHPIWRGIGCLMLIIIPVMAWAAAQVVLEKGPELGWFPRTREIYNDLVVGGIGLHFSLGEAILTLVFIVLGFLIFSLAYSFVYKIAGPPKYGPTDAPPPRVKKVRKKRK